MLPDPDLAADEQQRRDDQEQRHRQLTDDERLPHPRARRHALAALSNVGIMRVRVALSAGSTPHTSVVSSTNGIGIREEPAVERHDVLQRRHLRGKRHPAQRERHRQADAPPRHHEQQTLDEHRLHDARASGANRDAHGNLTPPLGRARHQQSGDVDARDEQHQTAGHQRQRPGRAVSDLGAAELHGLGRKHARRAAFDDSRSGYVRSSDAMNAVTAACACDASHRPERASTLRLGLARSSRPVSVSRLDRDVDLRTNPAEDRDGSRRAARRRR